LVQESLDFGLEAEAFHGHIIEQALDSVNLGM